MAKNLPDFWRRGLQDPFRDISRLQRSVDRLFADFLSPVEEGRQGGQENSMFTPACDVEEKDKSFLLKMDLPGIKKEDIKIELNENQLVVSGERKEERKEEKDSRSFYERSYGSFYRSFALPSTIREGDIRATYDNGVLSIELPKVEAPRSKQIQIGEATRKGEKAA